MVIPISFLGAANIITPDLIPDLALWLKADAGVTTGAGGVTQWNDQSSNNYIFTQSTSTACPNLLAGEQNGLPAVSFTAGTDWMKQGGAATKTDFKFLHDSTTDYTVFFVLKKNTTATATNYPIMSTARSTANIGVSFTTAASNTQIRESIIKGTSGVAAMIHYYNELPDTTSGYAVYCFRHQDSATNNYLFMNNANAHLSIGTQTGASTANSTDVLHLGTLIQAGSVNEKGGWNIGEIIVYKNANTSYTSGIMNYLRSRWGI